MDIDLDSSVTSPPQQSPSLINIHGTARTRFCVRKPKRSSKRRRPTGKRPSPSHSLHRYRSISCSHSQTDSPVHIPSFAHTGPSQSPRTEVSYMQFANLVQCNRFWETYGRARQWQDQHQIAYWKSRTITLENENNKLRTFLEGKSNLCQPNVQSCGPGRFGPTQEYTLPQYCVPNYHLQGQMGEQANATYGTTPVKTDQPSTRQYESSTPGSSRYNTPKINDSISYFRHDLNRIGEEVDNSCPTTIAKENNEDGEESFEFEINEEMMAFLEQSMKHKLELKEQREKEKLESEKEKRQYEYECSLPPQHICKQRIAEMKLLYGAGAPKIIGMETAVKLTFERRLKQHDPKLWPVIPLRP